MQSTQTAVDRRSSSNEVDLISHNHIITTVKKLSQDVQRIFQNLFETDSHWKDTEGLTSLHNHWIPRAQLSVAVQFAHFGLSDRPVSNHRMLKRETDVRPVRSAVKGDWQKSGTVHRANSLQTSPVASSVHQTRTEPDHHPIRSMWPLRHRREVDLTNPSRPTIEIARWLDCRPAEATNGWPRERRRAQMRSTDLSQVEFHASCAPWSVGLIEGAGRTEEIAKHDVKFVMNNKPDVWTLTVVYRTPETDEWGGKNPSSF